MDNLNTRNSALSGRELFSVGQAKWNDYSIDKANKQGLSASGWIYVAIKTVCDAGSTAPLVVYDANGEANYNHPLSQLLAVPNSDFSSAQQMWLNLAWLQLTGEACAKAETAIWPVSPDQVRPIIGGGMNLVSGYTEIGKNGIVKNSAQYTLDNMVRFVIPDPSNPAIGLSPFRAAARAAQTDSAMQDWNKAMMDNGGNPSMLISTKEQLSQQQKLTFMREIMMKFTGRKNAGRPMLVSGETQVDKLSLNQQEMDFLESRKWNRDEILAIYGVPPMLVGVSDAATYNNFAEAKKILWMQTVKPLLNVICEGYNKFYRNNGKLKKGQYIAPDYTQVDALSDNEESKLERAEKLFKMGVPMSIINDKLGLGLEAYEGWDQPFGGKSKLSSKEDVDPKKDIDDKTDNNRATRNESIDNIVDLLGKLIESKAA